MLDLLLEIALILMPFFRNLRFLHVRREANQDAHYLSQYSLHNLDYIWIIVLAFDLLPNFC